MLWPVAGWGEATMAKRWMLVVAAAWCLVQTTTARAQWGLAGQDADPRYDPDVAGNAAAEVCANTPSIEICADYLLWWLRDPHLSMPITVPGALGIQGPVVGQDALSYAPFSGARVAARMWHDNTQTGSLEIAGLIVADRSTTDLTTVGGSTLLVSSTSRLWGGEANLIVDTLCGVELIGGFRYLDLSEHVDLTSNSVGSTAQAISRFATRNQFYGGQIGAQAGYTWGVLTFGVRGKIAFGNLHQSVAVNGFTLNTISGVIRPGAGVLTGAANIGRTKSDQFSVLPEGEARVGWMVASGVTLYVGYDFLFLSDAVRPGDQIAGNINFPAAVPFNTTSFWAQGLNVGLELRY
ncbi:hypothetical protein AYO44_01845 [Planctomycetaceae bacterium SCGC AG-212-F19]|nr:hypothetical protein AYO44_01845 [Planctomycetaceae bacterium SCGC AG-212-F19]